MITSNIEDRIASLSLQKRDLFYKKLAELERKQKTPSLASNANQYQLSAMQESFLILENITKAAVNHITFSINIHMEFMENAFQQALRVVTERHSMLRCAIVEKGGRAYNVIQEQPDIDYSYHDLRGMDKTAMQLESKRLLDEKSNKPFILDCAPLWRVSVLHLDSGKFLVHVVMHHTIGDGWSFQVLLHDFVMCYNAHLMGVQADLDPLFQDYGDYVQWETERGQEKEGEVVAYWKQRLKGSTGVLELETDFPRPVKRQYHTQFLKLLLSESLTEELHRLSKKINVTVYSILMAAWNILLSRMTAQTDINVAVPCSNRNKWEWGGLIGCFINTIPLRTQIDETMYFREFVRGVNGNIQSDIENSMPYSQLLHRIGIPFDSVKEPLCQVMFVWQEDVSKNDMIRKICSVGDYTHAASRYDLKLELFDGSQIGGTLQYSGELFEEDTVQRMGTRFQFLLQQIAQAEDSRIKDYSILDNEEENLLVNGFNNTDHSYDSAMQLNDIFEMQALLRPNAIAVVFGDRHLTYRELNERSNQLARYLLDIANPGEKFVGIYLYRSLEMVLSIMAVMKAGLAYVPIAPDYPRSRVDFMIRDSGCSFVITSACTRLEHDVCLDVVMQEIYTYSADNLSVRSSSGLAYMIYTSGTTGQPKGTLNTHRGACNHMLWMIDALKFTSDHVFVQKTPYSFDVSVWEFFVPLMLGAKLVMLHPFHHKDAQAILDEVTRQKISVIHFVPSMLRAFLQYLQSDEAALRQAERVRVIICSGEELTGNLKDETMDVLKNCRLYNLYGPTEAAIHVTWWDCGECQTVGVPIGRPIYNTQIYILDEADRCVPLGAVGEIYIGGINLAHGYWNNSKLTSEKFVERHIGGKVRRLYKSGDYGKFLPSGAVIYKGRKDDQIKIKGCRIELSEITAAMKLFAPVADACALIENNGMSEKRIAAYLIEKEGASITIPELKTFLATSLPDYAIPSYFYLVDEFPLQPNGKLDKEKLMNGSARNQIVVAFEPPANEKEEILSQIWEQILLVKPVSVLGSFFEMGGDSILCLQMIAQASQQGIHITYRQVFEHLCIRSILAYGDENHQQKQGITDIRETGELTPIENWYFTQGLHHGEYYNQCLILKYDAEITEEFIEKAWKTLMKAHPALRAEYTFIDGKWVRRIQETVYDVALEGKDLRNLEEEEKQDAVHYWYAEINRQVSLDRGSLCRYRILMYNETTSYLVVCIHHLIIDRYSWEIIVNDLNTMFHQYQKGLELLPACEQLSFMEWGSVLKNLLSTDTYELKAAYICRMLEQSQPTFPIRKRQYQEKNVEMKQFKIERSISMRVLKMSNSSKFLSVQDILLLAFARAFMRETGTSSVTLDVESFGRKNYEEELQNTIGWFTAIYPIVFTLIEESELDYIYYNLENIHQIFGFPQFYGVMINYDNRWKELTQADILFHYLGSFWGRSGGQTFTPLDETFSLQKKHDGFRRYMLEINCMHLAEELSFEVTYDTSVIARERMQQLATEMKSALVEILTLLECTGSFLTPADFQLEGFSQKQFRKIMDENHDVQDILPLLPAQLQVLNHVVQSHGNCMQFLTWELSEGIQESALKEACRRIVLKYPIFRTTFWWRGVPYPIQIIHRTAQFYFEKVLLPDFKESTLLAEQERIQREAEEKFRVTELPLTKFYLFQSETGKVRLVWGYMKTLIDNWSWMLIMNELLFLYESFVRGESVSYTENNIFTEFIKSSRKHNGVQEKQFWAKVFSGFDWRKDLREDELTKRGVVGSYTAGSQELSFTAEEEKQIRDFCHTEDILLSTLLQMGYATALSKEGEEVAYAVLMTGRDTTISRIDTGVGNFTNILPIRVTLNQEQTVTANMKKLQERLISFHEHQSAPMELIVSATGISLRYFSFLVKERTFVYSNMPQSDANGRKQSLMLSQFTNDLLFQVPKRFYVYPDNGLKIELKYDMDLYTKENIGSFLSNYHKCILDIVSIGKNGRYADEKGGRQYGKDGI